MIQIRMMKEEDMQAMYGDAALKPLIMVEVWGDVYCIVAEEDGKIVGGLSGSISGAQAVLQVYAIGAVKGTKDEVLTEGLIRSILYVLDKRGVAQAYMVMDVGNAIRKKIGFCAIEKAALPEWIKADVTDSWSMDVKEFLAQDCCGCKGVS